MFCVVPMLWLDLGIDLWIKLRVCKLEELVAAMIDNDTHLVNT